jgi:general secretion pathway protein G
MNKENIQQKRGSRSGFTLVELMVVIAIIAILATIVGYNVLGATDDAAVAQAKAQIRNFKTALIGYKLKYKKFPSSLDGLLNNEKGSKFLDANEIPKDPWDNNYVYTSDGATFRIISYGADGSQSGNGYAADIDSDNLQGDSNK